jgi:hypothetical protein
MLKGQCNVYYSRGRELDHIPPTDELIGIFLPREQRYSFMIHRVT